MRMRRANNDSPDPIDDVFGALQHLNCTSVVDGLSPWLLEVSAFALPLATLLVALVGLARAFAQTLATRLQKSVGHRINIS